MLLFDLFEMYLTGKLKDFRRTQRLKSDSRLPRYWFYLLQ